jgi:hypothetical protein
MRTIQRWLPVVVGVAVGWFLIEFPDTVKAKPGWVYGLWLGGGLLVVFVLLGLSVGIRQCRGLETRVRQKPLTAAKALQRQQELEYLGFELVEPLLETISPPAVLMPFVHRTAATVGFVVQAEIGLGQTAFFLSSRLGDDGESLETVRQHGATNNSPETLYQVFPKADARALLLHHLTALAFLRQQGFEPLPVDPAAIHEEIQESLQRSRAYYRARPVWHTLILLYRSFFRVSPFRGPLAGQKGIEGRLERVRQHLEQSTTGAALVTE